jgi:hypothetical protein
MVHFGSKPHLAMANVTHSIRLPNGARAAAVKDGIEVRRDLNGFSEEVVCTITWAQIDHLRARVLDQR